jgi:uncharacterized protein (DUF1800 family)
MAISLLPQHAWTPLPAAEWNADTASHLLRRAGWTARPDDVARAVREGLAATLDRLFPAQPPLFEKPRLVARAEQNPVVVPAAGISQEERLKISRENSERQRLAVQELSLKWLAYAAQPANAAVAKWILFLSDVYVVSSEKVRNPGALHRHFEILGQHGFGPAPALTKAVSRSPAMVVYLDLNQSQRRAPNENFARELFELFVLGEGNYTEKDIKEAARAFTGYRAPANNNTFSFAAGQADTGEKTVFGAAGKFTGDDVIELAYSQPAAASFLPGEMARFYLSDTPLPPGHIKELGQLWRTSGFELRELQRTFFGSRVFYAPEFRGGQIKSPIQLYLGLVQDLALDIAPLQRLTILPLRQMGQPLFAPPNVRGWVGGRNWINSGTLNARRQFVELLFSPLNEASLNADDLFEITAARSNGFTRFTVPDDVLAPLAELKPEEAAGQLVRSYLPGAPAAPVAESLAQFIAAAPANERARIQRLRRAVVTVMQSPEYQLC